MTLGSVWSTFYCLSGLGNHCYDDVTCPASSFIALCYFPLDRAVKILLSLKFILSFFGCLLLTMRSVFLNVDFIFFECRKKFILCLTIFTICGLLRLWVMTNGRVLLLLSPFSLDYVAPQSLVFLLSRFYYY